MKKSKNARRNAIARWENEGGAGRSGATVDAPGKNHRKRAKSERTKSEQGFVEHHVLPERYCRCAA